MMNKKMKRLGMPATIAVCLSLVFTLAEAGLVQDFDFERLNKQVREVSIIVDLTVEVSFGAHNTEHELQYLGTVVTPAGLVLFNGSELADETGMGGFSVKTEPISIELRALDGERFEGEFVGVDRYTKLGFIQILTDDEERRFESIEFKKDASFNVGQWVALYMLLPDFIDPPLAADVGMVSTLVRSPEFFPLTVGFSSLQLTSVLYNEAHEPVGVLGALMNPNDNGGAFSEAMGEYGIPLLGVITAKKIEKLIEDPPTRGKTDRAWLGIRLQALTEDMAEFWDLDIDGGIIVNEIIRNSPAEQAGLEVGDIVWQVNGESIEVNREENLGVFQRNIAQRPPGESVELSVMRPQDGKLKSMNVIVNLTKAPMAATDSPEYEDKDLEFTVRNLVFNDYMLLNEDPESLSGVMVSKLEQGGLAEVGGLNFGDIIQRVGAAPVTSVEEFESAMEQIKQEKPEEMVFFVRRGNKTLFVNVKTDW
jgi:S1-C subfamily serine protease